MTLAAQGLPTVVPTGYENLDAIQMGQQSFSRGDAPETNTRAGAGQIDCRD